VAESQGNDAQNGTPGGQYSGPRAIDPVQEHSHDDDPDFITRTRFLSGVAIAGGAVLSAAILVPIVGFAVTDAARLGLSALAGVVAHRWHSEGRTASRRRSSTPRGTDPAHRPARAGPP